MHDLLKDGMRVHHQKGKAMQLLYLKEKWHGEYVWVVKDLDTGYEHIEVFGLNDYIEQYREAA